MGELLAATFALHHLTVLIGAIETKIPHRSTSIALFGVAHLKTYIAARFIVDIGLVGAGIGNGSGG